jgi:hypothetical protein
MTDAVKQGCATPKLELDPTSNSNPQQQNFDHNIDHHNLYFQTSAIRFTFMACIPATRMTRSAASPNVMHHDPFLRQSTEYLRNLVVGVRHTLPPSLLSSGDYVHLKLAILTFHIGGKASNLITESKQGKTR